MESETNSMVETVENKTFWKEVERSIKNVKITETERLLLNAMRDYPDLRARVMKTIIENNVSDDKLVETFMNSLYESFEHGFNPPLVSERKSFNYIRNIVTSKLNELLGNHKTDNILIFDPNKFEVIR